MKYITSILLLIVLTACSKEEKVRIIQEDPPTGEVLITGRIGGIDAGVGAQRFDINVMNDSQFVATDITCQFISDAYGVEGSYEPFALEEGQDRNLTLYRFPTPEVQLISELEYICYYFHKGQEQRREGLIR